MLSSQHSSCFSIVDPIVEYSLYKYDTAKCIIKYTICAERPDNKYLVKLNIKVVMDYISELTSFHIKLKESLLHYIALCVYVHKYRVVFSIFQPILIPTTILQPYRIAPIAMKINNSVKYVTIHIEKKMRYFESQYLIKKQ